MIFAIAVVDEDGPRDDRCWRHLVAFLDDGFHPVRGQDSERSALSGAGERVRVFAHIEWAIRTVAAPVVADGLGHGEDVCFGEGAVEWRASVSAGAEDDQLIRIVEVGPAFKILTFKLGHVHQHALGCGEACKGRNHLLIITRADCLWTGF